MFETDTTKGDVPRIRVRQRARRPARGKHDGLDQPRILAPFHARTPMWLRGTLLSIDRLEAGANAGPAESAARLMLPAPAAAMSPPAAEPTPHGIYLDHLRRGELAYQYNPSTGQAVSLPLGLLSMDGAQSLEWRVASGLGTVYRSIVVAQRGGGEYSVSLIDCDEGFRVMSRVEGIAASDVAMGMRVRAQLHAVAGDEADVYPVFVPLTSS